MKHESSIKIKALLTIIIMMVLILFAWLFIQTHGNTPQGPLPTEKQTSVYRNLVQDLDGIWTSELKYGSIQTNIQDNVWKTTTILPSGKLVETTAKALSLDQVDNNTWYISDYQGDPQAFTPGISDLVKTEAVYHYGFRLIGEDYMPVVWYEVDNTLDFQNEIAILTHLIKK